MNQMEAVAANPTKTKRFAFEDSPQFQILADALPSFALELVSIVRGYLMFPTATANAMPDLLMRVQLPGSSFGVACNNNGDVWVASRTEVQVLSPHGDLLFYPDGFSWASARSVAFAVNGDAFIVDQNYNCVVRCRSDGSFVRTIGGKAGTGPGQFDGPQSVAIDAEQGRMFVSDHGNRRVQVLRLDGTFVRAFGSEGQGPARFMDVRGLALSPAGELAVCDYAQGHVQVPHSFRLTILHANSTPQIFDYNGKFLRKLGAGSGGRMDPTGVCVDSAGNWLVVDNLNDSVRVFKADGKFITSFRISDNPRPCSAYGVCVDADGCILVCAARGLRVFCFRDREE